MIIFETKSFLNDSIKGLIQRLIYPQTGEVTWWGGEYSGAYQYTTKNDKSWIHADHTSNWGSEEGVIDKSERVRKGGE